MKRPALFVFIALLFMASIRAEDFVDMSFVKELDDSGYIDRLYGGR